MYGNVPCQTGRCALRPPACCRYAKTYDIALRYEVYNSLTPDANYLALADENGTGMTQAWGDINELRELIDMLNW